MKNKPLDNPAPVAENVAHESANVNPSDEALKLIQDAPSPSGFVPEAAPVAATPAPPADKARRGRPPLTDAEKAARAAQKTASPQQPKAPRPKAPPVTLGANGQPLVNQPQRIPPEHAARMINQAYESLLVITLGKDGILEIQEKQTLDTTMADYLRTQNYDVPPWLALTFCYLTVTVAKIQKPTAQEKVVSLWIRAKNYISGTKSVLTKPQPSAPEKDKTQ